VKTIDVEKGQSISMPDNTHVWLYDKPDLPYQLESPSPHMPSPCPDGNISTPPDQHSDLATTLINIANTYKYLKGLGFSDEALGPLVTTYEYLSHQETSERPLIREPHTKPLITHTSQDPDLQRDWSP
jgi:hypothetical protein